MRSGQVVEEDENSWKKTISKYVSRNLIFDISNHNCIIRSTLFDQNNQAHLVEKGSVCYCLLFIVVSLQLMPISSQIK